ncbi:MAG: glycine zipper 2TM domain-containing protein [Chitinivorax sp.]
MAAGKIFVTALCGAAVLLGGCAGSLTGETYSRENARVMQTVQRATVTSVRLVKLEGTNSGIGTVAGAGLGGIAGSEMGRGRGSAAGAIAGVVLGGIIGTAMENKGTQTQGIEVTVKMNDGREVAIVQEHNPNEMFQVGERVRLITVRGETRVAKD